jgi:hypothetical protein
VKAAAPGTVRLRPDEWRSGDHRMLVVVMAGDQRAFGHLEREMQKLMPAHSAQKVTA